MSRQTLCRNLTKIICIHTYLHIYIYTYTSNQNICCFIYFFSQRRCALLQDARWRGFYICDALSPWLQAALRGIHQRPPPSQKLHSQSSHITSSYHSLLFVHKTSGSQCYRFDYSVILRYQYFWLLKLGLKDTFRGKWPAIGRFRHVLLSTRSSEGCLWPGIANPEVQMVQGTTELPGVVSISTVSQHVNPSWSCSCLQNRAPYYYFFNCILLLPFSTVAAGCLQPVVQS